MAKTVHTNVTEEFYQKLSKVAKKNRKTMSDFVLELVEDGLEIFEDVTDLADDKIGDFVSQVGKRSESSEKAEKKSSAKKPAAKKKSSAKKKK